MSDHGTMRQCLAHLPIPASYRGPIKLGPVERDVGARYIGGIYCRPRIATCTVYWICEWPDGGSTVEGRSIPAMSRHDLIVALRRKYRAARVNARTLKGN